MWQDIENTSLQLFLLDYVGIMDTSYIIIYFHDYLAKGVYTMNAINW